jgi:acetoin utilization deacetylase AcuC-like enzyme
MRESTMTTGLVWHERYMWHDTRHAAGPFPAGGWIEPDVHAENPLTKRRFKNLLDASGVTSQLHAIEPRMASVDEICRFHERSYVDRIKALSDDNGGDAGGLTPFGPGSFEIALLSAGGVLAAVDAVLDGTVANAYALVRPPGHHALAGEGMGFCLFGNVAVAAHHLRSARGVARVAIVDWDVHHGNGTQSAFYADGDVLTISLHQDGCFPPGSGSVEENGEGEGAGANVNVPLPRGGGRGAYVAAFERVVVPALDRFSPDFVIVASGLDASAMDPLGRMQMHSDGYRELTDLLLGVAGRKCAGRLVIAHEGGYSSAYVPFCGLAIVEQLSGISSGVDDPMLGLLRAQGGDELAPHENAAIARCEPLIERVPAA